MKVSILGAGAVACGAAVCLAQAGHEPMLWSPSGRGTAAFADGQPLVASGALSARITPRIASTCKEAVDTAEVVMLALPAYGHKAVLDAAAPHLRNGQPVIISAHLSFAALYLSKLLAARGVRLPIVAWGTTLSTGRRSDATELHIGALRSHIDMATLPRDFGADGHALCTLLFGHRFVMRDGLLAIALSNLNPQFHLGIALLNLTRMELGEPWSQAGHITPAVGRLIEALDGERLAIAQAFDLPVRTMAEHFSLAALPPGGVAEVNQTRHRQGIGPLGPNSLDSRYVTEDVPFGLLPTVLLGRLVGRPALLHESGIALLGAAYGRDFAAENDLLPALGLASMELPALRRLARRGHEAQPAVADSSFVA